MMAADLPSLNRAGAARRRHWLRQVSVISRLEAKKGFLGRRAFAVYLLAILPVLLMLMLIGGPQSSRNLQEPAKAATLFADVYVLFILRAVIFFGCAWIFMSRLRGDVIDRTLHIYFLAAVRREVVILSKYLSGLLVAATVFLGVTVLSYAFAYIPAGYAAASRFVFDGPGLSQGLSYLTMTLLACASYGAAFLAIGLLARNAALAVALFYVWESINFLLPPLLKRLSIIYYLQSFYPIPISDGPFAIVAEPPSAAAATVSLLALAGLMVTLACVRARRLELRYAEE